MPQYKYQTLKVKSTMPFKGGPSTKGQAVGASVELLHKAVVGLGSLGLGWRINQEIEKLEPEIRKAMPRNGGVLICVGVKEWEHADPVGAKARMFLNMHVAGAGSRPDQVVKQYLARPRMVQAAPKGWVRVDEFIWVTPGN
jgi:hypothetical protein